MEEEKGEVNDMVEEVQEGITSQGRQGLMGNNMCD